MRLYVLDGKITLLESAVGELAISFHSSTEKCGVQLFFQLLSTDKHFVNFASFLPHEILQLFILGAHNVRIVLYCSSLQVGR
jgi:hypothetical protein